MAPPSESLFPACTGENKLPFFHNLEKFEEDFLLRGPIRCPETKCYTVKHAYVSPYGAVFRGGWICPPSVYRDSAENRFLHLASYYKKRWHGRVRRISSPCLVVHHSWYDNYYHWLIEILPRLSLVRSRMKEFTLLMHANQSPFHKSSLALLGVDHVEEIRDDELVCCDRVSFMNFPIQPVIEKYSHDGRRIRLNRTNVHPGLMKKIREEVLSAAGVVPASPGLSVYISRKKAPKRKVENEDEVETFLHARGFSSVFLEDLTFTEQVKLLYNTKILVGAHGAGMANIIFMQPGTQVLDFTHRDYHEFCFLNIANAVDVRLAQINSPGKSYENPQQNDVKIDMGILGKLIEELD